MGLRIEVSKGQVSWFAVHATRRPGASDKIGSVALGFVSKM